MNSGVNSASTAQIAGSMGRFRLSSLGELRLLDPQGAELLAGRRKELTLLAFLAHRAPRGVTREELAALLWGERDSARARQSLRNALHQLRRVLGDAVDVTAERVRIDATLLELDVTAFEREIGEGRLRDAVARWRGDFLGGAEDAGGESFRAWLEVEREALRRRLAAALDHLIGDALRHGRWDDAVVWAEQWTEALPLEEQAHRRLIEALRAAARPDEALARHAIFLARAREELGHEPSPAFKALVTDLARAARRPPTSGPGSAALLTPDMVGREAVLAELVAAWYEARAGRSTAVLIAADEGLGKSRLCQELARWVKSDDTDSCVLAGRAHEADRDAPCSAASALLAGVADAPGLLGAAPSALQVVARIVPAVGRALSAGTSDAPLDLSDGAETATAVCDVLEAVASELPVLLILDDAPFADAATHQILAAVVERSLAGVMLVMTGQPDMLSVSPLAEELRQSRCLRRLQLQSLSAADTEKLVGSMVALDPADRRRLAARLHAEGEGNPFYVSELVFALADDGTLVLGSDGRWRVEPALLDRRLPLTSSVREAVRRRLAALDDDERLCLVAAAADGRRVDPATLERATGLAADRVIAALDRLVARRLLRAGLTEPATGAAGDPAYEFAHEIVRRVAREVAPSGKRAEQSRHRATRRPARVAVLAGIVGVVAFGVTLATRLANRAVASPDHPTIAIVAIAVTGTDTTVYWLADGLPQMIGEKLSRSTDVEVIPPTQTRSVRLRAGHRDRATLSTAAVLDIATRLGATVAVSGELTRAADGALMLNLTAHDVATGRLLRSDALAQADVLALADEAAARLLDAAGAEGPGLRLADLETSSVAAYQHFVRANQLALEGYHGEAQRELDAAVALDSGFVSAVQARLFTAMSLNSYDEAERLSRTLKRFGARATEYDRLLWATFEAARRGEFERSEALARQLVRRRPRDPRAHGFLIDIYGGHGRWEAAEAAIREALALDSLGIEAGRGPCAPCLAYGRLVGLELARGHWSDAEQAARRWVALQPELPGAWRALAATRAYVRRYDDALAAMRRSVALSGGDPPMLDQLARMLVLARRLEEADSLVVAWLAGAHPGLRRSALDLRVMLDRERGRLRASNRSVDRALAADSSLAFLELIRGNTLGRLGDYAAAERVYELHSHGGELRPPGSFPPDALSARGFCWAHALLADAIAPAGDTLQLLAIADTLERGCARSYYGRDRVLHHHVRGLVHAAAGRYAESAQEFRRAQWVVGGGWSRTVVELAKAQLALGRPREAIASLTIAYATPLDAMGRYVPRSEIDYHMARAFAAGGMRDSATVHAAHVRRAWASADPEVKRLLENLER